MSVDASTDRAAPTLVRELGRWDLTAIGINQVIGSAVFLLPSEVARQVGARGPVAFLLVGLASFLIALCFAEAGSRFEGTGGPYLFARAAFGRLAGFEVGWMLWFTRASAQASVANGVVLALGFYWPALRAGLGRALVLIALVSVVALINVRGIRQSAWAVNLFTIGKLLPLSIFILMGVFFLDTARLTAVGPVTLDQAAAAALLLIFAFGGYEVVPVPAGEARDPRRHVPFAMVMTVLSVTAVMTLCQVVATGTVPTLIESRTPLADGALLFMGAAGALMISFGSVVSMTGNNIGQILSGSRNLFALAEHGDLPAFFGRVHPRFRTPANAVLFSSAVALALALTGSFVTLAAGSAVARLVVYTLTCSSTLVLRQPRFTGVIKPATFVIPFGPVVPVLAVVVSLTILAGATRLNLLVGSSALVAGAALFALNDFVVRRRAEVRVAG